MTPRPKEFDRVVRATVDDEPLQEWLADYQAVEQEWYAWAHADLGDPEAWRDAVAAVRRHTITHLDQHLAEFAGNVERAGGHVFFAADAKEARDYVVELARRKKARRIVKAKSMVTEEIELDPALAAFGAEVTETDLGAYIVQLSGEKPYHITGPALHKTKPQIRELFSREAGEELPDDVEALTAFARRALREKFLSADIGITGCNVGVASTGTVVLVTNEGNGRMSSTLPPTHVVVMGMERLVPDWRSLEPVLTMLPRAGTGERATTYVTAITGPRRPDDVDGPEELHVVIVDNGRSGILGTKYEPVLNCIRCGCCADFCPVYRTMGGYAYESVYTGPIGAVLTPLLDGFEGHEHLPFASSLCGACQEACPARVPLADLLLELRADAGGIPPCARRVEARLPRVRRRLGAPPPLGCGAGRRRPAGPAGHARRPAPHRAARRARLDGQPRPAAACAAELRPPVGAQAAPDGRASRAHAATTSSRPSGSGARSGPENR